jgi:hypothetical protein
MDFTASSVSLCNLKASWVELEQKLKSEIKNLNDKLSEVDAQNSSLHQQLETVSCVVTHLLCNSAYFNLRFVMNSITIVATCVTSDKCAQVLQADCPDCWCTNSIIHTNTGECAIQTFHAFFVCAFFTFQH